MARRRKKSKQSRLNSNGGPVMTDKSLPALPQSAALQPTFAPTPETDTPPSEIYTETPTETSPRARNSRRKEGSLGQNNRDLSLSEGDESRKENLTLPASTYAEAPHSYANDAKGAESADDGFFIPLALDPNPAAGPEPLAQTDTQSKDYFGKNGTARMPSTSSHREVLRETGRDSSRSSSIDRTKRDASSNRMQASPHIAYQQKGRAPSTEHADTKPRRDIDIDTSAALIERSLQSQSSSTYTSQATSPAEFKLQDAPKTRKGSVSKKLSKPNPKVANEAKNTDMEPLTSNSLEVSPLTLIENQQPLERPTRGDSLDRPARGDSLNVPPHRQVIPRKEVGEESTEPSTPTKHSQSNHERTISASSGPREAPPSFSMLNGGRSISKPSESPVSRSILDVPSLPARSTSRPSPHPTGAESFTAPRAAPVPGERHKASESISTVQSGMSAPLSSALPRYSAGENFSMDEEMGRILKSDQSDEKDTNMLRRVSNAANKHMRSFSDRGGHTKTTHKTLVRNGSIDISSPTSASPSIEDPTMLRNKLRRAQQRIAELEADKHSLQDIVNSSQDITAVNNELKQKRSTVAFLDTQRELVVRELEVMTDHLKRAKETNQPLDIPNLKSDILRDFKGSVQKLKDELAGQVEELIHERNKLTNEIGDIIQMKDKGMQEYEDLSMQNQQLMQAHNELVHRIQDMYKANKGRQQSSVNGLGTPLTSAASVTSSTLTSPNGLGIYTQQSKEPGIISTMEAPRSHSNDTSLQNLINEDADTAVVSAPHLVNIRKGGRANMWKKGSQAMAKNIKGIKEAFSSTNPYPGRGEYGQSQMTEGIPYGSMPAAQGPIEISGPTGVRKNDAQLNFWGAQKGANLKGPMKGPMDLQHGSAPPAPEDALFGSDLSARCNFEKRDIPNIVIRCIQEVEVRGIDVEGIYRKSGGSGQVNAIRQGFERDANSYDISDPDLDIHAVTSTLKQFFRRLPVPLISHDVYDPLLEAALIPDADRRVNAMRKTVDMLPKAHKDVLTFLIFHLARVMEQEQQNLMTSLNLAVVFAPTIMRPQSIEREMTDMQSQRTAIQNLLDNNHIIFGDSA